MSRALTKVVVEGVVVGRDMRTLHQRKAGIAVVEDVVAAHGRVVARAVEHDPVNTVVVHLFCSRSKEDMFQAGERKGRCLC